MRGSGIKINYVSDAYRLGELADRLRHCSSRGRVAFSRAINRSLVHMRSIISGELRDTYYIKKGRLDRFIRMKKARTGLEQEGKLTFEGLKNFRLSEFVSRVGEKSISVKILKVNRARFISPGGSRDIAASKADRAAVWIGRNRQVMARQCGKRKPIVLYGPSFLTWFDRPNVAKALDIEAWDFFERRLEHELRFMISDFQGASKPEEYAGLGMTNFGRRSRRRKK